MDVVLVIGDEISTWLSQCVCVCVCVAHKLIIIYVNILTSNKQHNKQKRRREQHRKTWADMSLSRKKFNQFVFYFIYMLCMFLCIYVFLHNKIKLTEMKIYSIQT